jgi:hypothetical protein
LASLRRANTADHAAEIGVMGLLTKASFSLSKDVRSYRAFERALIGIVDPRSALELALVHRLASLLWRLRRACAIETGLFEMQGEIRSARQQIPARGFTQPGALQIAPGPTDIAKALMRTDLTICWSATRNRCDPLCRRRSVDGRSTAPLPNVSCACPILTQPWLTARATTKRDCGARRRKQY